MINPIKWLNRHYIRMTLKKYYKFEKDFLLFEAGDTLTCNGDNDWYVDEDITNHHYSKEEVTAMVEQGIVKSYKPTKCSCKA